MNYRNSLTSYEARCAWLTWYTDARGIEINRRPLRQNRFLPLVVHSRSVVRMALDVRADLRPFGGEVPAAEAPLLGPGQTTTAENLSHQG